MAKKTYRRFSKKGLSKKNKLRKSKRKSLRSKRKSRKHGGGKVICGKNHFGDGQGLEEGTPEYIICQAKKVKKKGDNHYNKMRRSLLKRRNVLMKEFNNLGFNEKEDTDYLHISEITCEDIINKAKSISPEDVDIINKAKSISPEDVDIIIIEKHFSNEAEDVFLALSGGEKVPFKELEFMERRTLPPQPVDLLYINIIDNGIIGKYLQQTYGTHYNDFISKAKRNIYYEEELKKRYNEDFLKNLNDERKKINEHHLTMEEWKPKAMRLARERADKKLLKEQENTEI